MVYLMARSRVLAALAAKAKSLASSAVDSSGCPRYLTPKHSIGRGVQALKAVKAVEVVEAMEAVKAIEIVRAVKGVKW